MKKFILKLLIRLFFEKQRELKKIDLATELSLYQFKEINDVVEILKHNRTCMTLWHWETNSQEEASIVKGMALMLNIILNAHEKSLELKKIPDVNKRILYWKKYKDNEKTFIWNNILKAGRGNGDK